jgi:uncharacterized ferritin-like protein (DUF455 family)
VDLFETAERCLRCTTAADKITRTRAAAHDWGEARSSWRYTDTKPGIVDTPLRPGLPPQVRLVDPLRVPKRKSNTDTGKKAFVHALAHIEFNAINLAWDCVWRFRGMPREFYDDWIGVAAEEAEHFVLLNTRLVELGGQYGDLPAHEGLWEMAEKTRHDLAARMAMVPRVLEARGLDVTPRMIERMHRQGDESTAAVLSLIYEQEIGHVEIGSRWFRWACYARRLDPTAHFAALLGRYMKGRIKGPLNVEARRSAGFNDAELDDLDRMTKRS